jgi:hypothetical protein
MSVSPQTSSVSAQPIEIIWGPPRDLEALSRDAQKRRRFRDVRFVLITAAYLLPLAVFVVRYLRLEMITIYLWIGIIGAMAAFQMILYALAMIWWRFGLPPRERRQDLYTLTSTGLKLPQQTLHDPPIIGWSSVEYWSVVDARDIPPHRYIKLRLKRRTRTIWLTGTSRDTSILDAFARHAPQRLENQRAALRASR